MNPILLVILIIGIALVSSAFVRSQNTCPPPKVVYRYIPRNDLDVQFGEDNSPSEIYKDMFLKSNPWIGGYNLGDKTTILEELKSKKPPQQPVQQQPVQQQPVQQQPAQQPKLVQQQPVQQQPAQQPKPLPTQ